MSATALHEEPRPSARRQTRQRTAILEILHGAAGQHLSVGDIERAVRESDAQLHRATIYRILDRLVDDGLLARTELGTEGTHYEIARPAHHHHLVCDSCGHVDHVEHDALTAALEKTERVSGFDLAGTRLSIHGRCRVCRNDG